MLRGLMTLMVLATSVMGSGAVAQAAFAELRTVAGPAVRLSLAGVDEPLIIDDRAINQRVSRAAQDVLDRADLPDIEELNRQLGDRFGPALVNLVPEGTREMAFDEVFRERRGSVVMFHRFEHRDDGWRRRGAAGGVIISHDGVVATAHHVVEGLEGSLVVSTLDGRTYGIRDVLAANELHDVAIVQLDLRPGDVLDVAPVRPWTDVGADVSTIHHAVGEYYMFHTGRVVRYQRVHSRREDQHVDMLITAEFARGSSGSPIFDRFGNVVGIVSSTRSIYYDQAEQHHLQMVFRSCGTGAAILGLMER